MDFRYLSEAGQVENKQRINLSKHAMEIVNFDMGLYGITEYSYFINRILWNIPN